MDIIETSVFKKQINQLLDAVTYSAFRAYLVENPTKGCTIRNGRGLKKIRWKKRNTGKRYGIRIIYRIYKNKIYLLYAYDKKYKKNISREQIKKLAKTIGELE